MKESNENKMSDGGRGRGSRGMKVWKSSQKWSVQRSAVRSIAWLGLWGLHAGNAENTNKSNDAEHNKCCSERCDE